GATGPTGPTVTSINLNANSLGNELTLPAGGTITFINPTNDITTGNIQYNHLTGIITLAANHMYFITFTSDVQVPSNQIKNIQLMMNNTVNVANSISNTGTLNPNPNGDPYFSISGSTIINTGLTPATVNLINPTTNNTTTFGNRTLDIIQLD
ncbi:hypothetical protein, partial [Bacillus thuringiensis]|uniref:hypothetical protein n=1 Tax=Bacillus thuringiensis TaxID=1428 RepID=UPI000C025FD0